MKLCGICEDKTSNKEYCDACIERNARMKIEIQKRLKKKRSKKGGNVYDTTTSN